MNSVNLTVLLDAIESSIDTVAAPEDVRNEAKGIVRGMRDAATSVASSAAQAVVEAAVRHSLGL